MRTNWVYILTNKPRGVFYVGSTSNPFRRLQEHMSGKGSKHVSRYGLNRVVWFESYLSMEDALVIEHRMKRWSRAMKIEAIERDNPVWRYLSEAWIDASAHDYMN